jgi:hypothetical protein
VNKAFAFAPVVPLFCVDAASAAFAERDNGVRLA